MITSDGIVLPIAFLVWAIFAVSYAIFAVSIEMIVMKNNVKEFVFKTKTIWQTFFVRIIFRWLKTFHSQKLLELGYEKNKVDRLETYGIKHSSDWFQSYPIIKFLI